MSLIAFLEIENKVRIINDVADLIKNGDRIVPYQEYYDKIFKESSAQFLPVNPKNIKDYFYVEENSLKCRKEIHQPN